MTGNHSFEMSFTKLTIGFVCLGFAYLFKVLVLFVMASGEGQCLHTFWLGSETYFNPFFITVVSVVLFFVFGLVKLAMSLFRANLRKGSVVFYSFICIVLGVWLHGLYGLWQTFEYEKGNLSAQEYYSEDMIRLFSVEIEKKSYACKIGN